MLTKMAVTLIFLLYLAAFLSTVNADLFSEYAHHAVLDAEEKMELFWTIDWDAETVSFAVKAETTGWVGIGFSSRSGQMVGSDVVIGWVKDNKGYLTVTNYFNAILNTCIHYTANCKNLFPIQRSSKSLARECGLSKLYPACQREPSAFCSAI